jgi:glucosamine-6-phosphate deaminase
MQDYYSIPADQFNQIRDYEFNFVQSHEELCQVFAREMVDLIKDNASHGKMTKVILPVGPLLYAQFADLCNKEGVSCESLVIFAMDEYLDEEDKPLLIDHPLSFRAYFQHSFIDHLDEDKKIPEDQLIMPIPDTIDLIPKKIEELGGIDVTYGGLGINGHLAFNSPPVEEMDLNVFRNTTVRIVDLREGDIVQFAIGGTFGNLEIVPRRACTLGMSELLGAKQMHMVFMRPWHAGVLRRALFGPVTTNCPGSLVQLHSNVKVTITPEAAQIPSFSLLMGLDK